LLVNTHSHLAWRTGCPGNTEPPLASLGGGDAHTRPPKHVIYRLDCGPHRWLCTVIYQLIVTQT